MDDSKDQNIIKLESTKENTELNLKENLEPLEFKKEKKDFRHYFIYFIFVIIIVTFVFAPATKSQQNIASLGSYEGIDITAEKDGIFLNSLQESYYKLYTEWGAYAKGFLDNNPEFLYRNAYNLTLRKLALISLGKKNNISATQNEIDRSMSQNSEFIDQDGNFNQRTYKNTSQSKKLKIRNTTSLNIVYAKVYNDLIGLTSLSKSEKEFFINMNSELRQISFVAFDKKDYPEDFIKDYFKLNQDLFKKVTLSTITISDKNTALEVLKKLKEDKADFKEIARANSTDEFKEEGGSRGELISYNLLDFINKESLIKLLKNKNNYISDLIEDKDSKFMIIKLDSDPADLSLDSTDDFSQIKEYYLENEKSTVELYLKKSAQDFANKADKKNFVDLASEYKKIVYTTDFFPLNYGSVEILDSIEVKKEEGKEELSISEANNTEDFFKQIFSITKGQVSDSIILNDKVIVALVIDQASEGNEKTDTQYKNFILNQTASKLDDNYINKKKIKGDFEKEYKKYFSK